MSDALLIIHSGLVPLEIHYCFGVHNAMICCAFEWIITPQKKAKKKKKSRTLCIEMGLVKVRIFSVMHEQPLDTKAHTK